MSKQKINKLLIGTNNKGKLREIKSLLPKSIKILSTSEFDRLRDHLKLVAQAN